jgi:DNA-binding transcriptional MerR regulator
MTTSYSLQEVATLAGTSGRTVRYYIELGLIDRPDGETRAATYGPRHLERLIQIRKWQEAGLSLEEIREAIDHGRQPAQSGPRKSAAGSAEVWSRLTLADGVELHIEPGRAGLKSDEVRALFRQVMRAYETIRKESK